MEREFNPRILGIICNWCCYGGADLCGVSRFQYPPFIRLVRVMCSGRVDLAHVFRAFSNGMDAVFVGGCHINDCHYVTSGNYDALGMVKVCHKLLEHIGLNPERLRLEWVSAGEGIRFANIMNEYGPRIQKLGPLGKGEGIDERLLKIRLQAVSRLVPYIRLLLTEKLRPSVRTEEEYHRYFASEAFDRLFTESVIDKLAISQITSLLREGPLSTSEIASALGLAPPEVARHVDASVRRGLLRRDGASRVSTWNDAGGGEAAQGAAEAARAGVTGDEVDRIIARHASKSNSLIRALLEVQAEQHWLPRETLVKLSDAFDVPLGRVVQLATFYKTFSVTPRGRTAVNVCCGASCHVRGSTRIVDRVRETIGIGPGETDGDSRFSFETGSCQGCCSLGPEMIVDGKHHGRISPDEAEGVLKNH